MSRCMDGFPRHAWRFAGVDVIDDERVAVRECPSCRLRQIAPDGGHPPRWRSHPQGMMTKTETPNQESHP